MKTQDNADGQLPRSTRYEVAFAMAIGPNEQHRLMGMTRNASASGVRTLRFWAMDGGTASSFYLNESFKRGCWQ
jgi:hypothetical protein